MSSGNVAATGERRPGVRLLVAGLVLVLPVPIALGLALIAVGASQPDGTITGAPATVIAVLLVALLLAAGLGVLLTAIGLVIFLASRPRANAEARALLRHARDAATTPEAAAALQSAPVPGRSWRRALPVLVIAVPVLTAYVIARTSGAPTPPLVLLVLVTAIAWAVTTYLLRRRRAASALVAQSLRSPDDRDDQPALDRRSTALAEWARARGLAFGPGDRGPVVSGTFEGTAFTCDDRIRISRSQTGDQPWKVHLDSAETTLTLPFPTVTALVVTPDTPGATLRWSHLGSQVHLESGAFNDTFNVYCDDPVRARLVLNPAVMADLLDWAGPVRLVLAAGALRLSTPEELLPVERLDALVALAVGIERSARSALVT